MGTQSTGSDAGSIGHVADAASVGTNQKNRPRIRCSIKDFLSNSVAEYLNLLDWTVRKLADGKPWVNALRHPANLRKFVDRSAALKPQSGGRVEPGAASAPG